MKVDLGRLEGHVLGREVGVHRDVQAHLRLRAVAGPVLAANGGDRVVEEGHVQLEAHSRHVAGLLVAQQVAGPAQLQVPHGDGEP